MDTALDTLATALYVEVDEFVTAHPELLPPRPRIGIKPQVSDAEMVTLAVLAVLQKVDNESWWVRRVRADLTHLFPYVPQQSGYNKRLRKLAPLLTALIDHLARETSVFTDDLLVVDSTPIECGRSRETVKRSNLAGYAEYGYCASHSRYFWGLRLHLVCTPHGLPVAYAVTGAKADERATLLGLLDTPTMSGRAGTTIAADKNYFGKDFENELTAAGFTLLRKTRRDDKTRRTGASLLKPIRQIIESIFATYKTQLGLETHHGRTPTGVTVRILQRILALTAVIWHRDRHGLLPLRSLTPYDH